MSILSQFFLLIILCLFTPLVLWLAIAQFTDQPAYLALARSGLLLIGLATTGWAGLRGRPQMVWIGLTLLGIVFLTFFCEHCWSLPTLDLPVFSWFGEIKQHLALPIPPMSRITYGHLLVAGPVFLNVAFLLNDADFRQILVANLVFITVVVVACVLTTC